MHAAMHPSWNNEKRLRDALRPAPRGLHFPPKPKAAANHAKIKDIDTTDYVTRTRFTNAKGHWPSKHDKRDDDGNPIDRRWVPWYEFYDAKGHKGRRVLYGHWAMFGLCDRKQTLGLDTGCVWGGELTAWIPEEARFVSVPAREKWAGNFRPR
jgi:bis(5'-nucleosyl)-tetraphosphatase (symmetrical)